MTADTARRAERTFVLGLDGVPWGLISEWIDEGHLPNFERVTDEGASGVLESSRPANTPVAWPSIATGCWPDKHGIYEFMKLTSDYRKRPHTRNDLEVPTLWQHLNPAVVANVPMTYPPGEIDGKLVTGMMTPGTGVEFTYPSDLREEILDEIPDYQIGLKWSEYGDDESRFREDLQSLVEARRALLQLLMRDADPDWRLFFFVFTAPDRLQHLIWQPEVLLDHYRYLDEILGEVIDYCESHASNLFIVSDHGFGPVERVVYPNVALAESGYLTERGESGVRGVLSSVGISRDDVIGLLNRAGIDEAALARHLPDAAIESVATNIPGDHGVFDVDYSQTTAFHHGHGSIYVNDTERFENGIVPPSEVPRIRQELIDLFTSLTDPVTGESPLEVYDGETFFSNDPESPDVLVETRPNYSIRSGLGPDAVTATDEMSASHRSEGILFALGPNISPGSRVEDATLVDVAPTVLHSLGEPVSAHSDGDVLFDVFAENSPPATTSVATTTAAEAMQESEVDDDLDEVEDRLRGLGYLD